MLQNYLATVIRTTAALTNSYVACTVLDNCKEYDQLMLNCKYTKNSSTSVEIKVEYSTDAGTTYFQDTNASVSSGTTTLSLNEFTYTGATGNFQIRLPISARMIKVSAKNTGTVTDTDLLITAVLFR